MTSNDLRVTAKDSYTAPVTLDYAAEFITPTTTGVITDGTITVPLSLTVGSNVATFDVTSFADRTVTTDSQEIPRNAHVVLTDGTKTKTWPTGVYNRFTYTVEKTL